MLHGRQVGTLSGFIQGSATVSLKGLEGNGNENGNKNGNKNGNGNKSGNANKNTNNDDKKKWIFQSILIDCHSICSIVCFCSIKCIAN